MLNNNKRTSQPLNQTDRITYSSKKQDKINDNPYVTPNKNANVSPIRKPINLPNSYIDYETKYKILRIQNALLNIQLNKWKKCQAFNKIKQISPTGQTAKKKKKIQYGIENFDMPEHLQNQFMERIQQRVQIDKTQQRSLLQFLIEDFEAQRDKQLESVWIFTRTLQHKVNQKLNIGWKVLQTLLPEQNRKVSSKSFNNVNQRQKKIVQGFMILDKKFTHMKFFAWKKIQEYKHFGYFIVDPKKYSKQEKAKKLLNLNYLIQKQIKLAFQNWRISQTKNGKQLLNNISDNLVLYSNINKQNAFYRLLKIVRQKNYRIKVASQKIQQIFSQRKRQAFDKIKEPYLIFLGCLKKLTNNIILYSSISINSAFYRMMKGVVSQENRHLNSCVSAQFKELGSHSIATERQTSEKKSLQQFSSAKSQDLMALQKLSNIPKSSSVLFNK